MAKIVASFLFKGHNLSRPHSIITRHAVRDHRDRRRHYSNHYYNHHSCLCHCSHYHPNDSHHNRYRHSHNHSQHIFFPEYDETIPTLNHPHSHPTQKAF